MRAARIILLVSTLLALRSIYPGAPAAADTTSTPTPVVSSPEPTVAIASPEATDVLSPPTITREQSTPIITSPPLATEPPIVATSGPPPSPTPLPRATHVPAPTPTAVPTQAGGPPIYVPLPSPAELELNARLRWGDRVPASVKRWAYLIVPAAHKYGLDPNLMAAVMTLESSGDPLAWNPSSDARGLMQVLHGPWDPRENVFRGARILAKYYAEFHDLTLALAAYDAGPHAVLAYQGVPPYRETRDYVIVVRYLYDLFSHRTLTERRRAQYRSTLKDLQRFADARTKVLRLARIAGLSPGDLVFLCQRLFGECGNVGSTPLIVTLDPFWPVGTAPDPLQRVDPYGRAGQHAVQ